MAANLLMSLSTPMPAPPSPNSSKGGSEPPSLGAAELRPATGRRHYGRRRGSVPIGDSFVARLGPAGDEPFAAIDDPDDEPHARPPRSGDADRASSASWRWTARPPASRPTAWSSWGRSPSPSSGTCISLETLVHSNDRINPFARRIHGISSETLGGAPPVRPVLERFRRFCRGAVLVEHSADAFDSRLIAATLGESLDADNLDTSRLAAKLFDLRDTIGLERLCAELAVPAPPPPPRARRRRGDHGVLPRAGPARARALRLADPRRPARRRPAPATALGGRRERRPRDDASRRRRGGRRRRRAPPAETPAASDAFPRWPAASSEPGGHLRAPPRPGDPMPASPERQRPGAAPSSRRGPRSGSTSTPGCWVWC